MLETAKFMQRKSNLTRDARVYLLYAENITSSKGYLSLLTVQYTEKTSIEMLESTPCIQRTTIYILRKQSTTEKTSLV